MPTSNQQPATSTQLTTTNQRENAIMKTFKTIQVLDAETGQTISRSPEQQYESHALNENLQKLDMFKGMILLRMQEEKRYLDFHYKSMQDYCELHLKQSYRTVKRYIGIARKIKNILPHLNIGGGLLPGGQATVAPDKANKNNTTDIEIAQNGHQPHDIFAMLKVRVWDKLLPYSDEDVAGLFTEGEITAADGTKYTLEEIKEMSARQATAKLTKEQRKERKRLNDKIGLLKADNDLLKEEKKHFFDENKKLKEKAEYAKMIESKFGKKAREMEAKVYNLDQALHHFREFRWYATNTEISLDDPDEILCKCRDIYTEYEGFQMNLRESLADILFEIENIPDPLDTPEINAALKEAVEKQEAKYKKPTPNS